MSGVESLGAGAAAIESSGVASIYVHVPFCARQCGYCDFAIAVGSRPDGPAWLESIRSEWAWRTEPEDSVVASQLNTLYVGGGTPSLLGADVMEGLARMFGGEALANPELEWTGEANPESFAADVAESWFRAGVTRVSLGIQSFHEPTLRWMGRLHGPEGARVALSRTLDTGFKSVTADLIFGVPAALGRSWRADLDLIAASGVPHVSLYGLTVEPGTPLSRSVAQGRTPPVDDAQYREEYLQAAERLVSEGYEHYEVSSFARPGHRSAHNQGYWTGVPYLGLGNGAHSFVPPVRSWNVRGWPEYRDLVADGAPPLLEAETVDGDKARLENIWLSLRCQEGVATTSMDSDRIAAWVRAGHAQESQGRVRLTPKGWLLLDQLAVEASNDPASVSVPGVP